MVSKSLYHTQASNELHHPTMPASPILDHVTEPWICATLALFRGFWFEAVRLESGAKKCFSEAGLVGFDEGLPAFLFQGFGLVTVDWGLG